MAWIDNAIERLNGQPVCGYACRSAPAVEPTALAARALLAAGRGDAAAPALDWLAGVQSADGSLGIDADARRPCWPTGWALLAWNAAGERVPTAKAEWSAAARRAVAWTLAFFGRPIQPENGVPNIFGHNLTLQGWPWVAGTYSWVEPTAINVLALRSAGRADHPRCREAVKLLLDRQLPQGGWNYGNTTVFGRALRPQIQSSGLALAALAGEPDIRPKVQRSLDWLMHAISERSTAASLAYALLGLIRHGVRPEAADAWLASACRQTLARDGSPYHLALLVLAAKETESL